MDKLKIFTHINSRYQVFDASGQLPFSIVFGLCRKAPTDTDPRPLVLETAGSVLDVPYALAHGLLTLQEQDPENAKQWVEVELSRLSNVATKEVKCLALPSPVNRTEHWRNCVTVYQYHIDVNGELSSILEPGKKYMIRLASGDLGVKRWAYSDHTQFIDDGGKLSHDSDAVKMVASRSTTGNAKFRVVKSLPWPPRIETRMLLCVSSPSSDLALTNIRQSSNNSALEVSITNTGSDFVTVQTRGSQHFLHPWGPLQPEPDADDDRMRIIHPMHHRPPTSSLQVVDSATGEVVRYNKPSRIVPLTISNPDRRPKMEDVMTLKPEVPITRRFDIQALVDGLVDGQYKIRMQSKGCWWRLGEAEKENGEDGRVTALESFRIGIPPLMLETQDEVELRIRDGLVLIDQSM